ncbi:hypothetical protein RsoM2USA_188 [Ralstonia phage RsoM2USA]|nr:hypothetical protein RsoM2USA_188 [Ralstonia phage RsoM2USA]
MSKVIYSPDRTRPPEGIWVFLAGSIEMGKAEDWQSSLGDKLSEIPEVTAIFNPRRNDWDSSWVQSIDNPQFNEQVNWELDHIEYSDVVFMNFIPDTQSPITLAELGYILGRSRDQILIICCPDGFWRQGNVEIMAERSGLRIFRDYDEAVQALVSMIGSLS